MNLCASSSQSFFGFSVVNITGTPEFFRKDIMLREMFSQYFDQIERIEVMVVFLVV